MSLLVFMKLNISFRTACKLSSLLSPLLWAAKCITASDSLAWRCLWRKEGLHFAEFCEWPLYLSLREGLDEAFEYFFVSLQAPN